MELPGKPSRVWCRQCRCGLVAQLKALKTHAQSRKHLSNADQEPQSPPPAGQPDDSDAYNDTTAGGFEESAGYVSDRAGSPLVESDFSVRWSGTRCAGAKTGSLGCDDSSGVGRVRPGVSG